jgi:hypothetical protein
MEARLANKIGNKIFKKALSPLSENDLKRFLDIFSTISEGNQQAKENTITSFRF